MSLFCFGIFLARFGPTLVKKSLKPFAICFFTLIIFPLTLNLSGKFELEAGFLIISFNKFFSHHVFDFELI